MLKATILGCGCSVGTPVLGCKCYVCKSSDAKNKRQRSSVLIQNKDTNILIDAGPDIKNQLIQSNIDRLDGIILTHSHYDHIMGLDDATRVLSIINNRTPINLYLTERTAVGINHFSYLWTLKYINLILVDYYSSFEIKGIKFRTFKQYHHDDMHNIGIRINDFVYANDVINFPENSIEYLKNADSLVIDSKKYKDVDIHMGVYTAIKWFETLKPKRMFLTDMSHDIEYNTLKSELQSGIEPCFDGMQIEIQ